MSISKLEVWSELLALGEMIWPWVDENGGILREGRRKVKLKVG
jgi:hypothetical protein